MECEHRVSVLATGSFGTAPTLVLAVEAPGRVKMDLLRDKAQEGRGTSLAAQGQGKVDVEEDYELQRLEDEAHKVYGRILFDAGEGTQRLCAQFRVKSAKVRAICLTTLDAATAGGVGGIYFSLADAGAPTLAVRGPQGTLDFVNAHKRFIPRRWPEVNAVDVGRAACHQAKYEELDLVDLLMVTLRAGENAVEKQSNYCHWCAVDRARETSDSSDDDDDDDEEEEDDDDDDEEEEEDDDEDDDEEDQKDQKDQEEQEEKEATSIVYLVRLWQRINYDGKSPRHANEVCIDDVVMEETASNSNEHHGDASITFLGTGAAKPAKLRNCSGILLQLANGQGYGLLDVGEGSYSQMVRLYGLPRAQEVVRELKWICISHAHLDHHGGLARILEVRAALGGAETLDIYGPGTVGQFLEDLVKLQPMVRATFRHFRQAQQGLRSLNAQVCDVFHCRDAFAIGLLVPTRDGSSVWLVYSGDTRPSLSS
ncbi:Zinc phosphodiesterase ELAC protein 2 [Hondaea fermentalgiana]|uniref:ribonuclease Z n=1 Tax=Hondaea fermentalgiana TaxID=2315210 RepID=A0A2R5G284_9STRA|nr:Zinc phosphodiesterase ELAC protein 2 [Hondaea fermentalgiana]|eukprot:GBG23838.1 Zinc phosphodiesterase ELAC protein 2 [Hondaea fermentalgiana]